MILDEGTDEELRDCLLANVLNDWRTCLPEILARDRIYLRAVRADAQFGGGVNNVKLDLSVETQDPYASIEHVRDALALFGIHGVSFDLRREEMNINGFILPILTVEFREYAKYHWDERHALRSCGPLFTGRRVARLYPAGTTLD